MELVSGRWTGFYCYTGRARRFRMGLKLRFGQGSIVGEGADAIGKFVIRGRYDLPTRECWWSKGYIGQHEVNYTGVRIGKAIQGAWSIRQDLTGGFRIWPVGCGEDDEATSNANQKLLDRTSAPTAPL